MSQYPQPYYQQPLMASPEPSLPWSRALSITVAVYLVAGAIGGWIWQEYAPLARYTVDANGGSLQEEEMTRVFGPDGTFTSVGFIAGVVIGGALFWWLHRYGPWAVAVVVGGSALGSGVAWGVGMLLGHDPLDPRLEAAKEGDLLPAPLELHGWTPLASWIVGAALVAAVIAATTWRNDPPAAATGPVSPASEQTPWMH